MRDGRRREIERGARGKRRSGKRTRDTSKTKPHAAVNYRGCRLRIYLFPRCFFRRDRSQDPLLEEISLASSSPGLPADADPETADTRTTGVNCRSDKRGESTAFGRREIGGTGGWRSRIEREACRSHRRTSFPRSRHEYRIASATLTSTPDLIRIQDNVPRAGTETSSIYIYKGRHNGDESRISDLKSGEPGWRCRRISESQTRTTQSAGAWACRRRA